MTVQTVSVGMATTYYNKDNYYTKDLSSLDSWQGAISKKLDLEGKKIEPEMFDNFIKKMTERNGGNDNKKRVGIDLTFSCPKSISLALAKDDETKKDMIEAQQKAVKETLEEIEKNGGFTYRVTNNKVTTDKKADNLLIGKFNHFVNRNGELDLHTHCVVFNLTEKDGKEYSLNAKEILKKQTEWGLLFRQKMAKNLQAKGYKLNITDAKKGLFELAGFDREIIEQYSSRRLEILKKMEADGTAGSHEAMKANLQTRKTKKQVDLDKIYDKVRQEIFVNEKVKILKGRAKKNYFLAEQKKIADEVIAEMERETFAFTKDQLKKRIMSAGILQNIDENRAEKLINKNEKLVNLGNKELENGTIKQFFTTEKNINIEDNIIVRMNKEKGTIKTALSEEKSEKLLDEICKNGGYTPNREQVNAIHHILTNKDRIIGVQGLAGTGKTYSFTLVKKMADRENIEVKGICFTGKASEGLQADSGIESTTIHSFLNKLEKDSGVRQKTTEGIKQDWDLSKVKPAEGNKKQIWVVDEAGLVDSRMMNYLIEASIKADAKLVLTGDYQQLPPVGAGEPMKNLIDNGMATAYMEDIRRQKDIELLNAVRESVKGDTLNTYKILEQKQSYHEIADREKLQDEIIKKVTSIKQEDLKENLLLVQTNADRKNYNNKIQKVFIEQGRLTIGNTFKIENSEGRQERRKIYEGDRIVLLANDSMFFREIKGGLDYAKTKVNNGTMGTVKRVENDKIVVSLDNGKMVYFSPQKYKKFDLAYAVTNYKAQGMTVKNCIVDMTTKGKSNNRNALYVNISRAKFKAEVYTDDKKKLEKQTLNFAQKINSEDFREQIASYKRAKLQNTNYVPADERAIKKLEADFEAKEVPKKEDYQISLEKENIEEKAQCLAQNLAPKQKQPKVITRKMIHEMNKKAQNKDQERSRYLGR